MISVKQANDTRRVNVVAIDFENDLRQRLRCVPGDDDAVPSQVEGRQMFATTEHTVFGDKSLGKITAHMRATRAERDNLLVRAHASTRRVIQTHQQAICVQSVVGIIERNGFAVFEVGDGCDTHAWVRGDFDRRGSILSRDASGEELAQ